jgi:5-methylthioribose kinase
MGSLRAEKIRFQLIGMSAAVLQGVPVATLDVDLWLDLPMRHYMRAVNLALAQGAKLARNTVVELADGTLVNFIFEVTGLRSFATELRRARMLRFHGMAVPVMPLNSIRKSKTAIMRPKDVAHIHYIDETLRALKANRRRK